MGTWLRDLLTVAPNAERLGVKRHDMATVTITDDLIAFIHHTNGRYGVLPLGKEQLEQFIRELSKGGPTKVRFLLATDSLDELKLILESLTESGIDGYEWHMYLELKELRANGDTSTQKELAERYGKDRTWIQSRLWAMQNPAFDKALVERRMTFADMQDQFMFHCGPRIVN